MVGLMRVHEFLILVLRNLCSTLFAMQILRKDTDNSKFHILPGRQTSRFNVCSCSSPYIFRKIFEEPAYGTEFENSLTKSIHRCFK